MLVTLVNSLPVLRRNLRPTHRLSGAIFAKLFRNINTSPANLSAINGVSLSFRRYRNKTTSYLRPHIFLLLMPWMNVTARTTSG